MLETEREMTEEDARFYDAFTANLNQYVLSAQQFVRYLKGDYEAVPSETISALCDAMNMWKEATSKVHKND